MLPFSHEQFLALFAGYNRAIWPAQVVAYLVGAAICLAAADQPRDRAPWIAAGLGLLWAWTGAIYHAVFFASINPVAVAFGAVFVLQGLLFVAAGATGRLQFGRTAGATWRRGAGFLFIAYAALLYPLVGMAFGIAYPGAPTFGVTPCPVVLFTWGVLLLARAVPRWLVAIPLAWALVGGSAAILLDIPQDWPLLASGAVAFLLPRPSRTALRPA